MPEIDTAPDGEPPTSSTSARPWMQASALGASAAAAAGALLLPWDREGLAAAGYGGIFLVALVTGVAPGPTTLMVLLAARALDPLAVGLVAGIGSAIGESSSYSAGYGSHLLLPQLGQGPGWLQRSRPYRWVERNIAGWIERHAFLTLFLFGAVPNFAIDLAGIVAGRLGYPFRRYFTAMLLGKVLRFWLVAGLGRAWLG